MPPKSEPAPLSQTLPPNHKNATNVLLDALAELDRILSPLFATPTTLTETLAKLDIEKRSQLELMVAYAINTLAFSKWAGSFARYSQGRRIRAFD